MNAGRAPTPGRLLREARNRHGVTQAQLAIRAGTTQSAISRIERERVSPTLKTLRELLFLLGEDLELRALPRDLGVDRGALRERLQLKPTERLERGRRDAEEALARGGADRAADPQRDRRMLDEYIVIADEQRRSVEEGST